ncbi:hypothetical protein, partial [Leptospira weilii]|uniref:hypothetical protein n=1 Tax=Leptospira weilii TaxID=28184 RepID=UPI0009C03B15
TAAMNFTFSSIGDTSFHGKGLTLLCINFSVTYVPGSYLRVGTKFHGGFVGIPTDLSSDPSTCG